MYHHHNHNHHHHHHHDVVHSHTPIGKMKLAFFLTLIILLAEVIGGFISHSLALLSDAGHVLTDIAAIGLSWYALHQGEKPANQNMTFGYHRAGILAALINGISLIIITLFILWEAVQRFQHPQPVESTWMFIGAGVGLLVNVFLGLGLRHEENINVRSAVLHILGDAAASAGVILGGLMIALTGWTMIDPILSVVIALLIAFGAWRIVKQTVVILMEGTPADVEISNVIDEIRSIHGVFDVHDMHVWSITSGKNALSCHVVLDGAITIKDSQSILREIELRLIHLGIGHVTIQMEDADHPHDDSVLCRNNEHHIHPHEH
ncbi:CDF family zinc efflux transporter CzrB [Collibacillus ludicampi]|uniref:CDF family zinc efflux transporter CzrB n=1 Tax=Collibacillus ludicampi TaxID=2771369 RepID=A0AAV4LB38_9BACL|nr:cation diffusion facilitator family transporter [Collibacillus ludicampi]GIM44891.1 CDF family zinc efflux transporter CzrB [Collibacillus ludicampi]